mmetsp:Transcript_44122/g.104408  ORF Transcript_44122/g.104408 Transcript_44122/m.104408 type:complete len:1357 (-) Transcript_44122:66-4136(-)
MAMSFSREEVETAFESCGSSALRARPTRLQMARCRVNLVSARRWGVVATVLASDLLLSRAEGKEVASVNFGRPYSAALNDTWWKTLAEDPFQYSPISEAEFANLTAVEERRLVAAAPILPCTDVDFGFRFSECSTQSDGSRSRGLFPIMKKTCNLKDPTSRPMPYPVLGIPCEVPCEAGQHFWATLKAPPEQAPEEPSKIQVQCMKCEAGKYSAGGGFIIDGANGGWRAKFPQGLRSRCFFTGDDLKLHLGTGSPVVEKSRTYCTIHVTAKDPQLLAHHSEHKPITEVIPVLNAAWNNQISDSELTLDFIKPAGSIYSCGKATVLDPEYAGKVVLVLEGGPCKPQEKALKLQHRGASAVVMFMEAEQELERAVYDDPAQQVTIPMFTVSKQAGERILNMIEASTGSLPPRLYAASTHCLEAKAEHIVPGDSVESLSHYFSETWEETPYKHDCQPWQTDLAGLAITSGDNSHYHLMHSDLELSTRFVRDGLVRFRWKVSGEGGEDEGGAYDGFSFLVDGREVIPKTSVQSDFKLHEANITRGMHSIVWRYSKDHGVSMGEDRAALEYLEVIGTDYADEQCASCEGVRNYGYKPSGASQCNYCGVNEYLDDQANVKNCKRCPLGTGSTAGSAGILSCMPLRPCSDDDTEVVYEGFVNENGHVVPSAEEDCTKDGRSMKTIQWRRGLDCDAGQNFSKAVPWSEETECPPCQPYQQRQYHDTSKGGRCIPYEFTCPAGQFGARVLSFTRWLTLPSYFSIEARGRGSASTGEVSTGGWRLRSSGEAIEVGSAYNSLTQIVNMESSMLHLNVKTYVEGLLSFAFTSEPKDIWRSQLLFTINGTMRPEAVPMSAAPHGPHAEEEGIEAVKFQVSLPRGSHHISWAWKFGSTAAAAKEPTGIRLLSVNVSGANGGGVATCEVCHEGSQVLPNGLGCESCPPGTSASLYTNGVKVKTVDTCQPCPRGYFSTKPGSIECTPCGDGLITEGEGSIRCEPRLMVKGKTAALEHRRFDIDRLRKVWEVATGVDLDTHNKKQFKLLRVEDHNYFLSIFQSHNIMSYAGPGSLAGEPVDDFEGYWWQRLPPHQVSDVCEASDTPSMRSIGFEYHGLHAIEKNVSTAGRQFGERSTLLGVQALFKSPCGTQNQERTASLTFWCDPTMTDTQEAVKLDVLGRYHVDGLAFAEGGKPRRPDSCESIALEWHHAAACPACTAADYIPLVPKKCGANGKRRVEYIQKSSCYGGVARPPAEDVVCNDRIWVGMLGFLTICAAIGLGFAAAYVVKVRARYAKYMQLTDLPDGPGNGREDDEEMGNAQAEQGEAHAKSGAHDGSPAAETVGRPEEEDGGDDAEENGRRGEDDADDREGR